MKPRRTIRLALWTGEEEDYFGSLGYVQQHFGDVRTMVLKPEHAKVAAYFNLDNGAGRIRGVNLQGNEAVRPIFDAWLKPFNYIGATTLTTLNTGGTDHMPFDALGLPGFQFIQDSLNYETRTHHSNLDVYEEAPPDDMKQMSVVLAQLRVPRGDARPDAAAEAFTETARRRQTEHAEIMARRSAKASRYIGAPHLAKASRYATGTLCVCLVAAFVAPAVIVGAQSRPLVAPAAQAIYQRLLPRIEQIKIFDHHAHPGFADDAEVDPAPVPPSALLFRLRPDNPDWAAAARALEGATPRRGDRASWNRTLDRLGIETSVANRITMSADLDPARFKWVFYVDSFLFPFDNSGLAARNSDQAAFMPQQTKLLARFRQQAGATAAPASLDEYLAFVTRTLEDHKRRGAIAMKFEVAYFRSFVFDDVPRQRAAQRLRRLQGGRRA